MSVCHVTRLKPHPLNVRADLGDLAELAASIKAQGVLQPIVVEPHPMRHGEFVILAGHRRFAAAKLAGLDEVPITVRDSGGPTKAIEAMLVENLQRTDLNPMDKAEAMGKLRERGYSNTAIATAIGLTDATVSTYLALLELDKPSQAKVRNRELAAASAVSAVRKVRARKRAAGGLGPNGTKLTWEPDHFTDRHPLARKAHELCTAREHNLRRQLGKTACGQCWETVIRADERVAKQVLESVS